MNFRVILCAALSVALIGCGTTNSAGTAGAGGASGAGGNPEKALVTSGYVASTFGFFYPDGLESPVPGFDLDQRVSSAESPAENECAHDDFNGPGGEQGVDYNFLRIIFDEETREEDGKYVFGGFHEGQLVDGVINGAVKNGSMTVLLDIQGVDDPQNDDEVTVQVFGSEDSPMKGSDDEVLPYATLSVHPDQTYHTDLVTGSIVDGVLTAGPFDLIFPINIQIVQDEFVIHDSWLRIELGDDTFQGVVAGYWNVNNIRDIIGKPTTDNGNAANFTIEQFDAAMLLYADGDYNSNTRICTSFTTMFTFSGVRAFIAREGGGPGAGGSGGSGRPVNTPVDQCLGAADQAALEDIGGVGTIGSLAAGCPASSCGMELTDVLTSGGSDAARIALGDCIAQCISDESGLSRKCTDCYGSVASCSASYCLQPCAADSSSDECAECAIENCANLNDCTGL